MRYYCFEIICLCVSNLGFHIPIWCGLPDYGRKWLTIFVAPSTLWELEDGRGYFREIFLLYMSITFQRNTRQFWLAILFDRTVAASWTQSTPSGDCGFTPRNTYPTENEKFHYLYLLHSWLHKTSSAGWDYDIFYYGTCAFDRKAHAFTPFSRRKTAARYFIRWQLRLQLSGKTTVT